MIDVAAQHGGRSARGRRATRASRVPPSSVKGARCPRWRDAGGTLEILQCRFDGKPIRNECLIVDDGTLACTGAQSYRLT
ncbi:hypothetical protein WT24_31315 [Burkholderia sp. MSMB1078WGS]|uniref:hypothetical protein n=1 Tax=Burkholderia sp. MSMB1078WGS TaxID=1637900 RepID=UPI00075DC4FF|nr:hypothetical protein WT24_31315 [Burkholderia sp. MSMB1078WGS]